MSTTSTNKATGRKIAFVSTMAGNPWGGSEALWTKTAMHLRKGGYDVVASALNWPARPAPIRDLETAGVRFLFRPLKKSFMARLAGKLLRKKSREPLESRCMAWLRREAPDLVVISQGGPWEAIPWMNACRKLGLRYSPVCHANSEIWWPIDPWLEDIRIGYPAAARLFFVSNANMRLMELQSGFRFDNAEVVVNPVMVDAREALDWPDDAVYRIACVGRLSPRAKGQDLLLQVMAMPKWRERNLHLNFYGGGPCAQALSSLAEMLELENVSFVGHVDGVRKIWEQNHALVLPSRYEGLPMAIIEALLCGRPVITTRVAGNAEYIEEGVTGFVAEAPTVSLVDDALERAWQRRGDWRTMGATARSEMLETLPDDPIATFAERLLELAE